MKYLFKQAKKRFREILIILGILGVVYAQSTPDPPERDYKPLYYNLSQKRISNVKRETIVYGKFINYHDGEEWKEIDLSWTRDAQGFHLGDGLYDLDAPLKANGSITFTTKVNFSPKQKKFFDDSPVSTIKTFYTASNVDGVITSGGILYPGAFPNADLLLEAETDEFRYLIKWNSAPPSCTTIEIPFRMTYSNGMIPRKSNGDILKETNQIIDGFNVRISDFRGIGISKSYIWDSVGKREDIEIQGRWNSALMNGKKIIDCSFFDRAVYPVYSDIETTVFPDPSVEVTTFDGQNTNESGGDIMGYRT